MSSDFNHFGIDEWVAQEEARRREAEAAGRLEILRGGVRFLWRLRSAVLRVYGCAVGCLKRAYEKDGQVTREGVVREVAATEDRPGILGFNVSFNEKGDATGAAFYIFQVVGDHFELVKKVEME